MKRFGYYFIVIIILIILTACSKKMVQQSVVTDLYDGKDLIIGIIGDTPRVREDNVEFVEIEFFDLEQESFMTQYDAILITKENLSEAAEASYASIYMKSKIPFFFIQNKKSYIPFVKEDLSYEDVPIQDNNSYATGFIYDNNVLTYWGYCLYNDIENDTNVNDVFTRIFETITQVKNDGNE
jgi:hypothetical protein